MFEEEFDVVAEAIALVRAKFSHLKTTPQFRIAPRCGHDTFRRFGMAADYLRAEAVPGLAEQMCRTYTMALSFSCKLDSF